MQPGFICVASGLIVYYTLFSAMPVISSDYSSCLIVLAYAFPQVQG